MALKTANEYRERLKKMKRNVYANGQLMKRDDPLLLPCINTVALTFDAARAPDLMKLVTTISSITGE